MWKIYAGLYVYIHTYMACWYGMEGKPVSERDVDFLVLTVMSTTAISTFLNSLSAYRKLSMREIHFNTYTKSKSSHPTNIAISLSLLLFGFLHHSFIINISRKYASHVFTLIINTS